jgi:hypothetical protein
MDPYLEDREIWPDFHHAFATEIRNELNQLLPGSYYARLEMRAELGIVADEVPLGRRNVVPDVVIVDQPGRGGIAVLERPRRDLSPEIELELPDETGRHFFVEVRDSKRGHTLVTLIEILSPSNKRPGPDRIAYEAKQREVIHSDANLVEIDLLRGGQRVLPSPALADAVANFEPADYLVMISRAWRRGNPALGYAFRPFGLREWLPCIGVPLKEQDEPVPLDLQFVLNRTYDNGPYRRGAVDYTKPPVPPLAGQDAEWAEGLTRDALRGAI